jgi:hypothetical protein
MLKNTLSLLVIAMVSYSFGQITELSENFDAGLPSGWTMYNDANTPNSSVTEYSEAWILVEKVDTPGDSVISSTSFFEPVGEADRWLITPKLRMGSEGNILSWNEFSYDASFPDSYIVLISTTTNEKASFTDTLYIIAGADPDWLERSFDLAEEGYTTDSVYVAFVNNSDNMFKLALDSIQLVRDVPLSINDIENEFPTISVYPNPASEQIYVNGDVASVKVYSLTGQEMIATNSNTIQVGHFPSGVYLVNAITSKGTLVRTRFVKK